MKQQLIAWLNERLAHEENTFCQTDLLTTSRKAAKMDELRAVIEYVNKLEEKNNLSEILEKIFDESYYSDLRGINIVELDDVERVFAKYGVKQ